MVAIETCQGRPELVSTQELAARYSAAVPKGSPYVDFSRLQMTPDTAEELFECIAVQHREGVTPEPSGSVHILLTENRLGDMNVSQLVQVFKVSSRNALTP